MVSILNYESLHDKIKHRLGNLVLTNDNTKLGNKPIRRKIDDSNNNSDTIGIQK